jgi:hypothetical protein
MKNSLHRYSLSNTKSLPTSPTSLHYPGPNSPKFECERTRKLTLFFGTEFSDLQTDKIAPNSPKLNDISGVSFKTISKCPLSLCYFIRFCYKCNYLQILLCYLEVEKFLNCVHNNFEESITEGKTILGRFIEHKEIGKEFPFNQYKRQSSQNYQNYQNIFDNNNNNNNNAGNGRRLSRDSIASGGMASIISTSSSINEANDYYDFFETLHFQLLNLLEKVFTIFQTHSLFSEMQTEIHSESAELLGELKLIALQPLDRELGLFSFNIQGSNNLPNWDLLLKFRKAVLLVSRSKFLQIYPNHPIGKSKQSIDLDPKSVRRSLVGSGSVPMVKSQSDRVKYRAKDLIPVPSQPDDAPVPTSRHSQTSTRSKIQNFTKLLFPSPVALNKLMRSSPNQGSIRTRDNTNSWSGSKSEVSSPTLAEFTVYTELGYTPLYQ